ncbi:EAL domain-containing protein [Rhodanobacter aciditrophus]|uniref:EAL domain-containing protein n=1 Tax=Rhodanobacter aciditrophus TaxID=1623218 RepID=A0ABW4B2N2_9GAMM
MSQAEMALLKKGLIPYFQPIVEVSTGCITAFEALARYEDDEANVSSAAYLFGDTSISLKDRREIDQYVRAQAITKASLLPDGTRLTLNISPELIEYDQDRPIIHTIEMIERSSLKPNQVVIELLETKGQVSDLKKLVSVYRDAGMRIAVDDFGSGFSHFDRAIALEPDVIKLDMKLLKLASVGGLLAGSAVKSIVDFCTKSGAVIVVEGVETEDEFFFGLSCGAHYMQGFLFSPAQKEFLSKDTFQTQISALRKRFFKHMQEESIRSSERYNALITILDEVTLLDLETMAGQQTMEAKLSSIEGVLRYFIADSEGYQECPNYVLNNEGRFVDEQTQWKAVNWSWRPYFCQASCSQRAIVSDEYLDIHSGKHCKTAAVRLKNGSVLLVDINVAV